MKKSTKLLNSINLKISVPLKTEKVGWFTLFWKWVGIKRCVQIVTGFSNFLSKTHI